VAKKAQVWGQRGRRLPNLGLDGLNVATAPYTCGTGDLGATGRLHLHRANRPFSVPNSLVRAVFLRPGFACGSITLRVSRVELQRRQRNQCR
jgi:hypothetical protein